MARNAKPLTVGIMGGSASGKSTFAKALAEQLGDLSPVVINQDHYFRDWSIYPEDVRQRERTANHPRAVRWDRLIHDVERLRLSRSVEAPRDGGLIEPGGVVIVEGHLLFWNAVLRRLLDVKLYMDVDAHERVLRRLLRESERGGNVERGAAWYRRDVIPNFPVYTERSRGYADLVVPYEDDNPTALRMIASGIREWIRARDDLRDG